MTPPGGTPAIRKSPAGASAAQDSPAPGTPAPVSRARRRTRWGAALLVAVAALMWLGSAVASAHPLGNFTVNRYDGLTVHPDRIEDFAVVDTAEIPTLQAKPAMDTDHDGRLSTAEAASQARRACADLAARVHGTVSGGAGGGARALAFRVRAGSFRLVRGQAGLDTGRLECRLTAPAAFGGGDTVRLASGVDDSRIGWHEITARAEGVRIGGSDVPARSVSRELHAYPADLLSSPLDRRDATLVLGAGGGGVSAASTPGAGLTAVWYAALDRHLGALADQRRLTVPVGVLAVLMSLALGAGHAALPGHGKTIMAAYLAGRQGRPRDAVTVATTVTLTHTASVLALGVALSVSSALVGEDVLAWLGTVSGLVITTAGLWLLPAALRTLRTRTEAGPPDGQDRDGEAHVRVHGQRQESAGVPHHHGHAHPHPHPHPHAHPHEDALLAATRQAPVAVALAGEVPVRPGHSHGPGHHHHGDQGDAHEPAHSHSPGHHHDHGDGDAHGRAYPHSPGHHHDHDHSHGPGHDHPHAAAHSHGWFGRHSHSHSHGPRTGAGRGKGGLVGIGIAGGLVPSPSALVVLLGSIALGRTGFGVLLVVCYGLGMAATLAAAGLLLLRIRDRFPALDGRRGHALAVWSARLTPLGTALLILAVGIGTALRAVPL